jgi:Uma2 family endonuclease
MHIVSKRAIEGPPDVVVEILSPSTRRRDKLGKMKSYSRYRIPEYWIVEPELGTLEQYVLQGESYELINLFQEDETVTSPNLPCAAFTMNEIMEHIPEFD